jgi:hypothetical protein
MFDRLMMLPEFLQDSAIRAALRQTWEDSEPSLTGGHEEGGFVLRDSQGILRVSCWPKGARDRIIVPPHDGCKVDEKDIIATFHTHPNTGDDYLQAPGVTDRRAVRDDTNLKGQYYQGELVISQATIYLIASDGQVSKVGNRQQILSEGGD